jgi:nucleotide-binding universal stress UspA family protein
MRIQALQYSAERTDKNMSITLKNVAVAVDGSPASIDAIVWAAEKLDKSCRIMAVDIKDVRLFYNRRTQAVQGGALNVEAEDFAVKWDADADHVHEEVLHRLRNSGRQVEWNVVSVTWEQPTPASTFYDFAQQQHADALIVGRHHGSAAGEGIFGSFPRWLVTHADLPVMVIPPTPQP